MSRWLIGELALTVRMGISSSRPWPEQQDAHNALDEILAQYALEPCAECGHIDYRELDDTLAAAPSQDSEQ